MIRISNCLNCGIEFSFNDNQKTGRYCSNACQGELKNKNVLIKWKNGELSGNLPDGQLKNFVRSFIKERDGYKCTRCGWNEVNPLTKTSPLEVHHKDENHDNSTPENLITLCPNCHSLTRSWKNLGRDKRMVRYYKKKEFNNEHTLVKKEEEVLSWTSL